MPALYHVIYPSHWWEESGIEKKDITNTCNGILKKITKNKAKTGQI